MAEKRERRRPVHRERKEGITPSVDAAETSSSGAADADGARDMAGNAENAQRAEQQISEVETRYRALASAFAPVGAIFWTTPGDGQVDDMPHWRAFTGQTLAEVRQWGWLDAVHPDDRARVTEVWTQALAQQTLYEARFRLRRADGIYRLMEDRGAPVRSADGTVSEWVGILNDITNRQTAERRIAAQYAVSRILAEGATIDDIAPQLVRAIGEALEWHLGVFWMVDARRAVLRPAAVWHAPNVPGDTSAFASASLRMTLPPGVGLPGRTWAAGQPVWIPDVLCDRDFPRIQAALAVGLHAAFAFPVRGSSGVLGIVEYFRTESETPDDDLLHTLATLGGQIGQFLERTHAESEVRASETRMRAVLETALDCIIAIDDEGHILAFNPAAERTFGYRRDDVLGRELAEYIIPPEQRQNHRDGIQRYLATGEGPLLGKRVETTAQRADGSRFPVELAITAIQLDGRTMFTAYLRDITERIHLHQRTRDALDALLSMAEVLVDVPAPASGGAGALRSDMAHVARRLAELTQRVLECRQLSIAAIEPETDIMYPLALIGFSPEQEQLWWDGWRSDTTVSSRLGDDVAARLHADECVFVDMSARHHQSRLRPFDIRTLLVVPANVHGHLIGGLALNFEQPPHDIPEETQTLAVAIAKLVGLVIERERLLHEREQARAGALALEEANRRMDEFLGIVSHELRTPLTTIKASLDLAERRITRLTADGDMPAQQLRDALAELQPLLTRAETATQRQNRLVSDLLDISRIQSDRLNLLPQPVNLTTLVTDCTQEQRMNHPGRVIQLDVPASAVTVRVDAERIGQVITNFLTNALKYSPPDTTVRIRLGVEGPNARISVQDAGPGVPPHEQPHIWNRFHRVPGVHVLSGSGVGLGLGLYICKSLVERHGGQVGVESDGKHGSTFWFTLPLFS